MAKGFNIAKLRTDAKLEQTGVWKEAGEGLRLKIARMGNPLYTEYLNELLRPLREQLRGVGQADAETVTSLTIKAMAKHILLGWENLLEPDPSGALDEEGQVRLVSVTYTVAKAEELLQIKDFAEIVSRYAQDMESFRIGAKAAAEGN